MKTSKLQIRAAQFVNKIGTKFQCNTYVFGVQLSIVNSGNVVRPNAKKHEVENTRRPQTSNIHISQLVHKITNILMFSESENTTRIVRLGLYCATSGCCKYFLFSGRHRGFSASGLVGQILLKCQ